MKSFNESYKSDRYKYLVGKTIRIEDMDGEPRYTGREGVVEFVDDAGQLHGTWGGLAVLPGVDQYTVIREAKRIEEAQESIKEVDLACGPGKVQIWYSDNYGEDYDEYENSYNQSSADAINDQAQSEDWNEDLSQYFHGKGLISCTFKEMKDIDRKYYMVWHCIYDEDFVSLEDVKDYLTGQLSDGWGEGFEQYPFGEDRGRERKEFEEEDEDGNISTYYDTVEVTTQYYYHPWTSNSFEVKVLNS